MRTDLPTLKRCCLCLPLRYGLIAWTYIKLAVIILCVLILSVEVDFMFLLSKRLDIELNAEIGLTIAVIIILIVEFVFSVVFLFGSHAKNVKVLSLYYKYSFVNLASSFVVTLAVIGVAVPLDVPFEILMSHMAFFIGQISFFIFVLLVQIYVILLVRSEIAKLSDSSRFDFVNHTAEAACTMTSIPLSSNPEEDVHEIV